MKFLASWSEDASKTEIGPVAQALLASDYDRVLLADQSAKNTCLRGLAPFSYRREQPDIPKIIRVKLSRPTNFEQIYSAITSTLDRELRELQQKPELTFLSLGTPAMAASSSY